MESSPISVYVDVTLPLVTAPLNSGSYMPQRGAGSMTSAATGGMASYDFSKNRGMNTMAVATVNPGIRSPSPLMPCSTFLTAPTPSALNSYVYNSLEATKPTPKRLNDRYEQYVDFRVCI